MRRGDVLDLEFYPGPRREAAAMVASIGKIASPAQGVGYFETDGHCAKDDGAHREASAWAGKGADQRRRLRSVLAMRQR